MIDIDRFKAVNDINGHAAGDACLRRVADELRRSFRDAALVARIGGDEFAVLMRQGVGARQIAFRLGDFLSAIGRPVRAGGRVVTLGASAGVALPGPEGDDAIAREGMFATADAALYAAKAAGRNTYRIAGRQPPERHLRQA
ncbi:MAG: GGDEF domain-containing protein [Sphingomonas sp.]